LQAALTVKFPLASSCYKLSRTFWNFLGPSGSF
jgi:hypothetical protein